MTVVPTPELQVRELSDLLSRALPYMENNPRSWAQRWCDEARLAVGRASSTSSSPPDPPFDADELVRWTEMYGHPEEWAKRAQSAHARADRLMEALLEKPERWTFATLVLIARTMLDIHYPADVFIPPGVEVVKGTGDPGVCFVVLLREALAALDRSERT